MRKNMFWSDDGQQWQLLCHQSVLGIYNENLRSLLDHYKMKEYVLILQDINHIELIEFKHKMYSSFDIIIQNIKDDVLLQNTINEERISVGSLQVENLSQLRSFSNKVNIFHQATRKQYLTSHLDKIHKIENEK